MFVFLYVAKAYRIKTCTIIICCLENPKSHLCSCDPQVRIGSLFRLGRDLVAGSRNFFFAGVDAGFHSGVSQANVRLQGDQDGQRRASLLGRHQRHVLLGAMWLQRGQCRSGFGKGLCPSACSKWQGDVGHSWQVLRGLALSMAVIAEAFRSYYGNLRIILKYIFFLKYIVNWINPTQERSGWRYFVNTVMNECH